MYLTFQFDYSLFGSPPEKLDKDLHNLASILASIALSSDPTLWRYEEKMIVKYLSKLKIELKRNVYHKHTVSINKHRKKFVKATRKGVEGLEQTVRQSLTMNKFGISPEDNEITKAIVDELYMRVNSENKVDVIIEAYRRLQEKLRKNMFVLQNTEFSLMSITKRTLRRAKIL